MTDNQFGFKERHAVDTAIYAFKEVVNYYNSRSSPVFICFLDASKAFDRINHWMLYKKLIHRKVPLYIVRFLLAWYSTQLINIRWGSTFSTVFKVTNGVKQGGIMSPRLFNVYMDDLSKRLNLSGKGCQLHGTPANNFGYADDMCLVAPSRKGLQRLIDICSDYAVKHDILYNTSKTVCMIVPSKKHKCSTDINFVLNGNVLSMVNTYKYLGCNISCDLTDDVDIQRQRRSLLINVNRIVREFAHCTDPVKIRLFKTFCTNMYCSHLWSNYKKSTLSKIRVTYNNALRKLLRLPYNCSASNMFVVRCIPTFEAVRRKYLHSFKQRLMSTNNLIIQQLSDPSVRNHYGFSAEYKKLMYL